MSYQATTATKKILNLTKRVRIVQGGTSASKTVSILLYLIHRCQSDKSPTLTSIVAESVPHLKRGAIRDFILIMREQGYFNNLSWNMSNSTYTFETGSIIEFFSADQPDKLRGARRDRLFMNECNNMTFDAFEQLEVRTREFVFLDYNPTTEFWVQTEVLLKRNDYDFVILTYKDNEALEENIIKSIEQRQNRPNWWKVFGLGQMGEMEDKIYTNWQIVDDIPHEARLVRYGLDYGYTNDPSAIVAVYSLNGGYIIDEIAYQKGLNNDQISDILLNVPNAIVIPDNNEPKSNDYIREKTGLTLIATIKGKDSVSFGIDFVQRQRISVTKRSVHVIKEYRNYFWMTDKTGKRLNEPEHEYSHSMDAIRYALTSMETNDDLGDEMRDRQEARRRQPVNLH